MNNQERLRRKRAAKGQRKKARSVQPRRAAGEVMDITLNPPSMWKRDGMDPEQLREMEEEYYEAFPDERPKAEEAPK